MPWTAASWRRGITRGFVVRMAKRSSAGPRTRPKTRRTSCGAFHERSSTVCCCRSAISRRQRFGTWPARWACGRPRSRSRSRSASYRTTITRACFDDTWETIIRRCSPAPCSRRAGAGSRSTPGTPGSRSASASDFRGAFPSPCTCWRFGRMSEPW